MRIFVPRECEEAAEEVAMQSCHWLNKTKHNIRHTPEYKEALVEQLRIYYWDELYNLFTRDE